MVERLRREGARFDTCGVMGGLDSLESRTETDLAALRMVANGAAMFENGDDHREVRRLITAFFEQTAPVAWRPSSAI